VRNGEVVKCGEEGGCGGLVKPDIVFFGEGLPDKFFKSLGVGCCFLNQLFLEELTGER